ncbi:precorrin-2 dehydrogenase/sirohydrochlorin ferrochelatase family protein [Paenibacillus herberti]|uniref:precorrin-2 dehydrogenase n=1 Tax=Paenibacillus herberti TaxID=1619309 RepID=A0A229P012_9BACL|nr:bifunctional precorrin-2 dehydrogenase/sirohydrochlorin ferrochelatase [Paenibacillus herberti]OXM15341.1 siroheme synthase [Paenibacillus herberti]
MNGYPVVLRLKGRRCLIAGGGPIAERKALGLLDGGADQLTVISPSFTPQLLQLANEGRLELIQREYQSGDAGGQFLIIAATGDMAINGQIGLEAEEASALFNDASNAELSAFATSAAVRQGNLLLSVNTGGEAPALSAVLREELAQLYGSSRYAEAAALLGELRRLLAAEERPAAERRERLRLEAQRLAHWAAADRQRSAERTDRL